MGIIRDSFVIYKEWDDAIRKAPNDIQLECYHALMDYATTGEMPKDMSWGAEMFMTSVKKRMDAMIEKYQISVENGKKGGRPPREPQEEPQEEVKEEPQEELVEEAEEEPLEEKTKENPEETKKNPAITQENPEETQGNPDEPKPNLNVHVNVHDNVLYNKKEKIKEKTTLEGGGTVLKDYLTDAEIVSYVKEQITDKKVCERFLDFVANRRAMGKKHAMRTKRTVDLNIKDLKTWAKTPEEAIEILDYSIKNNYQGLFKPKVDSPPSFKTSPADDFEERYRKIQERLEHGD